MDKTPAVSLQLGEALSIFSENLVDIKEALSENMLYDLKKLGKVKTGRKKGIPYENLMWVRTAVHEIEVERITVARLKIIKRIVALFEYSPKAKGNITPEDIARAKEMPIEEMYSGRLFKSGGKSQCGLCPFHEERTPSFHIYKDNRYKCFGCQEHGDAIEFYMKQNNMRKDQFPEAIKRMVNK